jgi:CheY-like chemotaxis protein
LQAREGSEALHILRSGEAVDLLFTDVVMPGMSGPELASAARSEYPSLKVLYTTGYNSDDAMAPDALCLQKPFEVDQLATKLRSALA